MTERWTMPEELRPWLPYTGIVPEDVDEVMNSDDSLFSNPYRVLKKIQADTAFRLLASLRRAGLLIDPPVRSGDTREKENERT